MKILLFSHTGVTTGGAEQCLLEYVDVLVKHGHNCKVVVPYKGAMSQALSQKGIDWVAVGYGWATQPHRNVNRHKILSSTGNSLTKIFQEVEKFNPDAIIANTAVIPWGLYAGRAFKIPTVLLVHEILNEKDPSLRVVPSYEGYTKILNESVDYVIYNSKFVKNEFANSLVKPKNSSAILYPLPPIDKNIIDTFYIQNKIENSLKIAIFGALSPRKNQMEAVKAAHIMKQHGVANFQIDLYGDTAANVAYTKSLRKFIKDNNLSEHIKIKGYATEIYRVINEYNVVLSTATYEPFGRTIIEGQLFGRIAVSNNTGGGNELVDHERTGLLYNSGNPEDLAEKIEWIIKNTDKALAVAKNSMSVQFDAYITDHRYDALLEPIEHIANHPRADSINIFDPMLALFEYNHQLNNKYKHLYRITHNRITYKAKATIHPYYKKSKLLVKRIVS